MEGTSTQAEASSAVKEETQINKVETMEEELTIDTEEESNAWKRPAPIDEDALAAEREAKKPKVLNDAKSRSRNSRMFGLLNGTLSKFKEDTKKTGQSDAQKRRAALESRLSAKLKAEQDLNQKKQSRAKEEKQLRLDVSRKIDEKVLLDNIYKKRQSAAIHLAHFLVTSHASTEPSTSTGIAKRPALSSTHPLHSSPAILPVTPIYYLPYRLTAAQDQLVEDQVSEARKKVDADKEDYLASESAQREKEIEELKAIRDEKTEQFEREEREERIKSEREERDRAEEAADKKPSETPSSLPPRAGSELPKEDVQMADSQTGQQQDEDAVEY